MIVDDQAVIRGMLRELFEVEELDVSDAVNGADGPKDPRGETRPHDP